MPIEHAPSFILIMERRLMCRRGVVSFIGGMNRESSVEHHRIINQMVWTDLASLRSAHCLIWWSIWRDRGAATGRPLRRCCRRVERGHEFFNHGLQVARNLRHGSVPIDGFWLGENLHGAVPGTVHLPCYPTPALVVA